MSEENNQVCPQCSNHCSSDALRCGRGRQYFNTLNESQNESQTEESNMREAREEGYAHNHEEGRGRHGRRHGMGGMRRQEGRCESESRECHKRNHGNWDTKAESGLEALLGRCGHYLYHQKGRRGGQEKILSILAERVQMSQKELQEQLEIQAGSMSEIVMKLEAKGFLTKAKDENDKRMTKLTITEAGIQRAKEAAEEKKAGQDLFEALTKEEQDTLEGLLQKLTKDWENRFVESLEGRGHRHGGGRGRHGEGRGRGRGERHGEDERIGEGRERSHRGRRHGNHDYRSF